MVDIFEPEKRHQIMASIRSKDTKIEMIVFRYLRSQNVYFQKHYRRAPIGTPDIALPRKKKAVFIDSEFWHGKNLNVLAPKLNEYWMMKITKTIERDKQQTKILENRGWTVLRIWSLNITRKSTQIETLQKIKAFLQMM